MPKRTDIHKILIIGSGPIIIGQACEFDYSGTQACKALRAEGYEVVLVNSNPATIMTDPELADRTYIEPLAVEYLEAIIARERPDALLPTVGGQTALNLSVELAEKGVLDRYHVQLIGASLNAIKMAEDRLWFKDAMRQVGLEVPRSVLVNNLEAALKAVDQLGLPLIIRPSFTLGGTGSGVAYNRQEFEDAVRWGLQLSPVHEVLVEESVLGWKEYELEVMRDHADNAVVVCSIENFDPMGIHTGDSITVAPAQTLTDKEYQRMRDAAFAVIRVVGVETGGSNIQFAVEPETGRMVVIEMNPRVSRSSALASKATGFPIAKIAARLAIGYRLDEIPNDITQKTPSCFEPTIDYVVVKIPKWAHEKFPDSDHTLGTQMKSVGEVMAIGRTFKEALMKGLRSLETGRKAPLPPKDPSELLPRLTTPHPERLWDVFFAFAAGMSIEQLTEITRIDPWFLNQIQQIVEMQQELQRFTLDSVPAPVLREAKRFGFSDLQLAELWGTTGEAVRDRRRQLNVRPVFKRVDTCAAEFESYTPYLYSSYEEEDEAEPTARKKIIILGSGPNRIGQGIEFDYCCCHAAFALKEEGYETIMVNCNPETVSTDYDTADRLYFEPLTFEDVMAIVEEEQPAGVIVQFGGQTPLNLARQLKAAGVPIIGTTPESIDLAEDRKHFGTLLADMGIPQPENGAAMNLPEALEIARRIGYPVLVRPSYVLGGRAMVIAYDETTLADYVQPRRRIAAGLPDPGRSLPRERHRGGCGRARGWGRRGNSWHHGTHRRGGHSLRRQFLRVAGRGNPREPAADVARIHGETCAAIERGRPHERPVRHPEREGVRAGGQSPGFSHRSLCQQSHGRPRGEGGRAPDGGSKAARVWAGGGAPGPPLLCEVARFPVPEIPRGRHAAGARNEIHGRSDGCGRQFRLGFRQGPIGCPPAHPHQWTRVPLRE